ncbi:GNA1162 family protein [Sulfurimonas sp.]|uniref:GNA1162 family protein n=1 Tax=Sulfurimonas sp. TaxID=2022749 RepID=UPI002B486502|nr:GNA1162 family protein [Sulfurimonas sp.]
MKNKLTILLTSIVSILIFTGCGATYVTKGTEFPKMYEQQPRSILILPPMNESTDAEAKDYYMTTTEMPFALMGYYTFPTEMVSDIMKQEGVYDTEILYNMPLDKYYEYFGADTVLFTRIKKWDVSYMILASNLTISIEAKIMSTKTSEELWKYTGTVVVDLSGGDTGGGIVGLITKAILSAVNTATADYVQHAHTANRRIIYTLPAGPYNEMHMKDQSVQLIDQTPGK